MVTSAPVETIFARVEQSAKFQQLRERMQRTATGIGIEGVNGAGKALVCAALASEGADTAIIVTYNAERVRSLSHDLKSLLQHSENSDDEVGHPPVLQYPSISSAIYDGVEPDAGDVADRLKVLQRLAGGRPAVIVASIHALLQLTMPAGELAEAQQNLRVGANCERDELAADLINLGYRKVELVEDVGQFSVRGDIVDVSPPTTESPLRIELFGNEIEAIREFDPATQRSTGSMERFSIGPATEILLKQKRVKQALPNIKHAFRKELDRLNDRGKHREAGRLSERMDEDLGALGALNPSLNLIHYAPFIYRQLDNVLDYLPEDANVIIDEPVRVQSHGERFSQDMEKSYKKNVKLGSLLRLSQTALMPFDEFAARYLASRTQPPVVYLMMLQRSVPWATDTEVMTFRTPPVDSFGGKFDLLVEAIDDWQHEDKAIIVCTDDVEKTVRVLKKRGLQDVMEAGSGDQLQAGKVLVTEMLLSAGFSLPCCDTVVLTANEIYGWRKLRRPEESTYQRGFSMVSLHELHEGDPVVHINHGIGIYRGLQKQTVDDIERDYLVLEYADDDKLYVPVTQLDRIQRYIGAEGANPDPAGLNSTKWQRKKRKAKKSTQLLARELMRLYTRREQAEGFQFSEDSPWLAELENSFRYPETDDQLQAIAETYRDMQKPTPMDRLICGDVGFGKTEVAIRASFKAVLDGKQVAVLVPTTVLAHQHFNTFQERLSRYPVEIGMLSRFKSRQQQHDAIQKLKKGSLDIVIGTHRLLGSDIDFDDLGLLVIDEEQRFGVKQKERLKKFREQVDVLTLTATPIPRTLNMALSGIRQISVINDPPQGRMPIRTFVRESDDDLIREAVRREIERGGQVYFVHNRVHSIPHVASRLQRLIPEANIAVAHGQLPEDELEQVMMAFYAEEVDVLVCTTIIENGLDVPNVNTIIIDDADRLGLAQLYQLRGRVGRSNRQAYAYLLYKYPRRMTEEAEERLAAIEEFSDLASGFKLALRDLEIRGAGEILGAEQSGQLNAVGFDMYCKMLADAVKTLKGDDTASRDRLPSIDIPVETVIPAQYVPAERQRIEFYRQLASVDTIEELEQTTREIKDRHGRLPQPVKNLVRVAKLKLKATDAGVEDISTQDGKIIVELRKNHHLRPRERRSVEGIYKPTRRQARKGARSPLPRLTVKASRISFAYDSDDRQRVLDQLSSLLELLNSRAEKTDRMNDKDRVLESANR